MKPLPKPEPVEEAVYADDALMGGVEVSSTTGPLPSPRSPTPLSYADDKPVVQGGKETRPTPRATGQEQPRPAPPNSIVLERPRKVPRRSGNLRFTIKDETQLAAIGTHSIHDRSHVQEDYSGSKVKVEEGSSVPKVKKEEGNSAQKIKKEEGSSAQKIKEEVGVNKFSDLKVCRFSLNAVPSINSCTRRRKKSWKSRSPNSKGRETISGGKWLPSRPQESRQRPDLLVLRSRPRGNQQGYR